MNEEENGDFQGHVQFSENTPKIITYPMPNKIREMFERSGTKYTDVELTNEEEKS